MNEIINFGRVCFYVCSIRVGNSNIAYSPSPEGLWRRILGVNNVERIIGILIIVINVIVTNMNIILIYVLGRGNCCLIIFSGNSDRQKAINGGRGG